MGFNETQQRKLRAKLQKRYIRSREANGKTLSYLNGWHVISQANKIFGFDSWDRQTLNPKLLWSERRYGKLSCMYSAKVRITVRAGDNIIIREGIGTGAGHNASEDVAHDIAIKAAETDATKRALATFGNPFGLELYNNSKNQSPTHSNPKSVTALSADNHHKKKQPAGPTAPKSFKRKSLDGNAQEFHSASAYRQDLIKTLDALKTGDEIYKFWELNLETLTQIHQTQSPVITKDIIACFKHNLRKVNALKTIPNRCLDARPMRLLAPKERRVRDKTHLKFVARHPCVICGRMPTQAHHIKFAQPRAMSLKVSDEFTVPLCNTHHDQLHRSGNEKSWWEQHSVDPLSIAEKLWNTCDKTSEIFSL